MPVESAADLAGMFSAADFAVAAVYRQGGDGAPIACTVIPSEPDADFGQARARSLVARLTAAMVAPASPARGDTLRFNATTYRVEDAEADLSRAVWTLTLSVIA